MQYAVENGTPYFPPGEEGMWKYSNTGYILLGMIAEKAARQSLDELVQERIFDPLGLETAVLIEGVPQEGEITSQGYWWLDDGSRANTTNWNACQGLGRGHHTDRHGMIQQSVGSRLAPYLFACRRGCGSNQLESIPNPTHRQCRLPRLLLALPWGGNNAELYEQTQHVLGPPGFHNLALIQTVDGHPRPRSLIARSWNPNELFLLCSVSGPPPCDLVPFDDHIVHRDMEVRHAIANRNDESFVGLEIANIGSTRIMVDEFLGIDLICYVHIASIPKLLRAINDTPDFFS